MAFLRCDIFSGNLGMQTQINVIIPDQVKNDEAKVVYLLHGLSDNSSCWTRLTSIERYANAYGVAVVMPEVQRSFYADMKYGLKYFSYITEELPIIVNKLFNLPTDREHSFIAGLSMGGYGAYKSAFTYPEKYSAVAGFSSVCDIEDVINGTDFQYCKNEFIAIFGEELIAPKECDLFYLIEKANKSDKKPRIYQACGTEDFLYNHNEKLRTTINSLDFDYKYEEWSGNHNWLFWDTAVQKAFEFFFK